MPPSLRQIARHTKVAPSTVSRALSGQPDVGEELAQEIRRVAAELSYRPKPMRRRVNKVVGLLVCTSADRASGGDFDHRLVAAVLERVGEEGWHLHSERIPRTGGVLRLVETNFADGLMVCGHPSPALCAALGATGKPVVVLDDLLSRTGLTSVIPRADSATEAVVRRLAAMGHRRVAMIAPHAARPAVAARVAGYRRAATDAGLEGGLFVRAGCATLGQGQEAVRGLMRRAAPPTALVFTEDLPAVGAMLELGRLGIRVPEDVSIVGHGNLRISRESDPALTTVDPDMARMVCEAFGALCGIIEGGACAVPTQLFVEPRVIWRGSCAPCDATAFKFAGTKGRHTT